MTHPLQQMLDTIAARRAERPVVIFDLDGTLYDNRSRTLRILHAFAASLGPEHRADARAMLAMTAQDLVYRLDDSLRPRGVAEAVRKAAQDAWFKRFFTDAACADDVPHRGAVRFVRACYDRGATVVYLTGRDIPNMLVGTVRTLRDDGFPIGRPRIEMVLKPTFEEDDKVFKSRHLDDMDSLGVVVGTFENEPGNTNLFAGRWPDAMHVFVDTHHAPNPPPLDSRAVSVKDFVVDA